MLLTTKSFFVAGLRGGSLFAKLVFTVLLAKLLTVEQFGQWILIVAIVNYGVFIIGAEIYNLTLRTYIADGHTAVIPKFSAQWTYFAASYAVIFLVGVVIGQVNHGALGATALVIALLLILEHLTLEMYRLATFRDHQVHANIILLIKTALWMVPVVVYLLSGHRVDLQTVLGAWLAGALSAATYALLTYRAVFYGLRPTYLPHFIRRLSKGYRLLVPFLILALAARTPLILDRYFIEHFAGAAQVGPYGYYATFGNGVQALFDAVILAKLIPRLLGEKNGYDDRIRTVISFMRASVAFWVVWLAFLCVLVPYVNGFVGKESFQDTFGLMLVLFAGQMIFSLATIAQYGLYAMHRDRQLSTGAMVYLGLSLIFYVALIPKFGSYGAATALAVAAAGLLALRVRQLLHRDPSSPDMA